MLAFDVALALIIGVVLLLIVKAVRQIRGEIDRPLRGMDPHRSDDIARDLAARIGKQADQVKCLQCGGPTFILLGTETQYKCESCHFTVDGPPHMPDPTA